AWTIAVSDGGQGAAQPVALNASLRGNGLLAVSVRMSGAGNVHWIDDPVVGDRIAVVTIDGTAMARGEAREFVEFASLATAAGLAFKPYSDDLSIDIAGTAVQISRADGLTLSVEGGVASPQSAAAVGAKRGG